MTAEEQARLREVISKATRGVDSIGMYAVPGGHGTSNWICWVTGDLLTDICAIEGEDGFDPVVYAEAARAMKNFYRIGIHPDGSPFEGLGKNSLAAQNLLPLAKRGEFALSSENVYNLLWETVPEQTLQTLSQTVTQQLLSLTSVDYSMVQDVAGIPTIEPVNKCELRKNIS